MESPGEGGKGLKTGKRRRDGGKILTVSQRIGKSRASNRGSPNIQLSSARNVSMNTSGGTFNTELKLAEMALLLL